MIRRGFWMAVGAVIGVSGYRKATRLARTLTGEATGPRLVREASGLGGARNAAARPWAMRLAVAARETAGFVRDVRVGMADYRAEHDEQGASGQQVLHDEEIGRSLGSRSLENLGDRARPGPGQRVPHQP